MPDMRGNTVQDGATLSRAEARMAREIAATTLIGPWWCDLCRVNLVLVDEEAQVRHAAEHHVFWVKRDA